MQKIATKMQLNRGQMQEYRKRHNPIWPELATMLKSYGISDYSIFLDEETYILFAVFTVDKPEKLAHLKSEKIMQTWWDYMKDVMPTNPDNSPIAVSLTEMFFLS